MAQTFPHIVDCGPDARPAFAPHHLERLASLLRTATGPVTRVNWWPYRYLGSRLWAFDVVGAADSISLTFAESGRSHLPNGSIHDYTGELTDSVDAHYLFSKLAELLNSSHLQAV